MGLLDKVKLALLASRLWDRLKKEFKMGHAKPALFGLGAAIVTAIVAHAQADCPCLLDVIKAWPTLLSAGLMAGVGVYLKPPKQS